MAEAHGWPPLWSGDQRVWVVCGIGVVKHDGTELLICNPSEGQPVKKTDGMALVRAAARVAARVITH